MKTLPSVDVVIVGGGWTGLLMAKELGSRTSLSVVVLERGQPRNIDYAETMDELDYEIHLRMMQDLARETVTVRHSESEHALPVREYGSFTPGSGIGGSGEHWGAICERMPPDCFDLLSKTIQQYGSKRLPKDHSIQDWGITYDEMEPYYTRAEMMIGVSGKAGNLRGRLIEGGNIFEGWRSTEYPTPPTKITYFSTLVRDAAKSLGYHPYPAPAATISQDYTNPDGVSRPACIYCGYCEFFGCMIDAKAQPTNTLLPVIERHKNVTIRTGASVRRVLHDAARTNARAQGVTYVDASGEEVFQPAALVFLAALALNNTRLLLLSGMGEPYNPATGKGSLGRNLSQQVSIPAARVFLEKPLNRFMGSAPTGINILVPNDGPFDHNNVPFLAGGVYRCMSSGSQPIAHFGVVPQSVKANWGSEWKKAAIYYYDRTGVIGFSGDHLPYKGDFMDLDPTYKDCYGDPLLRLTIDWRENERQMAEFVTAKAVEIARAMGAKQITPFSGLEHYDTRRYQSTMLQGGTIMGASPDLSVINPYLQHWQFSNLFVLGGSSFPQRLNGMANTLTMLALTFRTADAITDRYLKNPGLLA